VVGVGVSPGIGDRVGVGVSPGATVGIGVSVTVGSGVAVGGGNGGKDGSQSPWPT
jgi:hypothetical protein